MAKRNPVIGSLAGLGGATFDWLGGLGRFWLFALFTLSFVPRELLTLRGWARLIPQCVAIGTRSVPVVMLTGTFVGMVLVVQGYSQFEGAGFADRLGAIVNISVVAELGPVLAGVVLAGRVGGALTAELGTMNVTEQLLALRSMGAEPVGHLATPRFLSCLLLTPVLTCYANLMGALGGWAVFAGVYEGDSDAFWAYTRDVVELWDVGTGLLKSIFFGGAIGLISCYKGFHCRGGAEGVGQACTESFVASFIIILAMDFFLNIAINKMYEILFGFRSLI